MKLTLKLIIQYLFWGISWGCTFFVFSCLVIFLHGGEKILLSIVQDFPRQALGAVIAGIAWGSSSIVYLSDRLSHSLKILIHFAVGMAGFYPVALYLGWFSLENTIYIIIQFLISLGIFSAIWFCFYLLNRNEAKRINARLRELEEIYGDGNVQCQATEKQTGK